MKIVLRRFLISAQIGVLVAIAPTPSMAEDANPFAIGFDIAVLRTLGATRLAVGMVALIPTALLFTLKMPLDGNTGALREAAEILVVEPANYVFRRPLGEDFGGE